MKSRHKYTEPIVEIEILDEEPIYMSGFAGEGEYDPEAYWE